MNKERRMVKEKWKPSREDANAIVASFDKHLPKMMSEVRLSRAKDLFDIFGVADIFGRGKA